MEEKKPQTVQNLGDLVIKKTPDGPESEWLHDWQAFSFPLKNGANEKQYAAKLVKYIEAWLDLYNDVSPNAKKFKLKHFEFVASGFVQKKAFATVDPAHTTPEPPTKDGEGSGGGHGIPHPPPPPPDDEINP